jgi:murein L,D-transpeptidase YcbB/YkuD
MRAMNCRIPSILILVGFLACTPAEQPVEKPYAEMVGSRLRAKIESDRGLSQFSCRQEILCGSSVIPVFYQRRGFAPAWSGDDGPLPQADSLMATIRESEREGLNQYDYHMDTIESLLSDRREKYTAKTPIDPEKEADLDLLLTDAFLLYGSHLLAGRVNPETLHTDWVAYNPGTDLAALLESALAGDNVATTLLGLLPPHPGYAGLQNALMHYRNLASRGGWPVIPPGENLRKGHRSDRVGLLRNRLAITGDLDMSIAEESSPFDEALETAVRRFQRRHGLADDGVVGRDTLAALNVPVEERVRQIELNMERWRWIPHDMGDRHILVNIPDYKMSVVENTEFRMDMRIIVGKDYTATPVFSGSIKYLEVNPYWNIPQSIAVEEILPKIRNDVDYLAKQKIKVFESWRENAPEIDPGTVDWNEVDERGFSFKLRQDPGPLNPLGRVKFIFPNKFAVYLHDTPARGLFQNPTRGFSHGCIRVEKPLNLAATLLRDDIRHSPEKILETIESGVRETIPLREPMPVYILYWTAWVDDGGTIQFRKDIYGRDNPLDMALKEPPPAADESQIREAGKGKSYQNRTLPTST